MGRAKIFADVEADNSLDLSGFAPKGPDPEAAPAEHVRAIAEAANFYSREPAATSFTPVQEPPAVAAAARRQPRTHRTGRNVQFNVKAAQETINAFYAISDAKGWVLGETLEKALSALQRELAMKP